MEDKSSLFMHDIMTDNMPYIIKEKKDKRNPWPHLADSITWRGSRHAVSFHSHGNYASLSSQISRIRINHDWFSIYYCIVALFYT